MNNVNTTQPQTIARYAILEQLCIFQSEISSCKPIRWYLARLIMQSFTNRQIQYTRAETAAMHAAMLNIKVITCVPIHKNKALSQLDHESP